MAEPKKKKKPNWLKIKLEYVGNATLTYSSIAEKYSIPLRTVTDRGVKEGWAALRKKTVSESEVKMLDSVSDVLAETNQKHASTYRQAQAYVNRRLQLAIAKAKSKEDKATEFVVIGSQRLPIISDDGLMSPQQIMFLMNALKVAVDGERVALGLATNVTKNDNDININDPFLGYRPDQLQKVIDVTDAKLREQNATDAELAGED